MPRVSLRLLMLQIGSVVLLLSTLLLSPQALAAGAPTITSFTPAWGPSGTVILVTGTNFTSSSVAQIGSANVQFTYVDPTQAYVSFGAGVSSGAIRIANAVAAARSERNFVVTPTSAPGTFAQPVITGLSPNSGAAGSVVTVTGTGFNDATQVWLGSSLSVAPTIVSSTRIDFTVPPDASTGRVIVVNLQRAALSTASFTVTAGGGTTGSTTGGTTTGTTTGGSTTGGSTGGSTGGTTGGTTTGGSTTGGSTTGGSTTGGTTTGGTTTGGTTTGGTTTGGSTTGGTTGGSGPIGATEAARFLTQATFGPKLSEINSLATATSFDPWLTQQRNVTPTLQLPYLQQREASGAQMVQAERINAWLQATITGPDQLRQRVAFALSEMLVVSENFGALNFDVKGLANYYDILIRNAFGNYRTLLEEVTLSPQMGLYLSMIRNQKPDPANGIRSDENYAREIMQLFTVGLNRLNLDGTPQRDANGKAIPTYNQAEVEGLARVFTGFGPGGGSGSFAFTVLDADRLRPMSAYQEFHDTNAKTIIGNTTIAAGQQALPELRQALDVLFNHPNVGPFVSQQLIRKLVTANPSPAYVQRVATVFNNNGSGVRGDLFAVTRAILTDIEARGGGLASNPSTFGKLREPVLRLTQMWRAFDASGAGGRFNYDNPQGAFIQAPLRAPSVFNFFRPDFAPTGAIANAGLVSPEFQVTDEASISTMINELNYLVGRYRSTANPQPNPSNVVFDFRSWETLAQNPPAMVDQLNLLLMSGQMPSAMRTELINYANQIPLSEGAAVRVSEVLYLLMTSPQYAMQR